MKLKLFLVLFFMVVINSLYGQSLDCNLLKNAIETEYFNREFSICQNNQSFIIYDKNKVFPHCSSFELCGKSIFITQDSIYRDFSPNKYEYKEYPSIIVLYRIVIDRKKNSLMFWRPYSGANLTLTFQKKKKAYKLIDYETGTF